MREEEGLTGEASIASMKVSIVSAMATEATAEKDSDAPQIDTLATGEETPIAASVRSEGDTTGPRIRPTTTCQDPRADSSSIAEAIARFQIGARSGTVLVLGCPRDVRCPSIERRTPDLIATDSGAGRLILRAEASRTRTFRTPSKSRLTQADFIYLAAATHPRASAVGTLEASTWEAAGMLRRASTPVRRVSAADIRMAAEVTLAATAEESITAKAESC